MIIVSPGAIDEIGSVIINTLIGASDPKGRTIVLNTVDPALLRAAALAALTIASGDVVWPLGTPPIEMEPGERLPFVKVVYPR